VVHALVAGTPPAVQLAAEKALQETLIELAEARLVSAAHDCSEGGLAVALAEMCFGFEHEGVAGVDVELVDDIEPAPLLFGEAQGRAIVACSEDALERVLKVASARGVTATVIGTVTDFAALTPGKGAGPRFRLRTRRATIDTATADLAEVWRTAIPRLMDRALTEH
jgi:phosphoribosylformylglycinamidine synthase